MNLDFINQDALEFVVEENGLLSYVEPRCNAKNDFHTPISEHNDASSLGPDADIESKANDQNKNLSQKTEDAQIQFNAVTSEPDYIPENEDIVPYSDTFIPDPDYIPDNTDNSDSDNDMPYEELVEGETDLQNNDASGTEQYGNMNEGRKRTHRSVQSDWKKNKNKKLRMEDKQYLGYTKAKGEVMKHNQIREARSFSPACNSDSCKRSKKRMCEKFTEEDRKCIFTNFWSKLSWDQRKMYVISHVNRTVTQRKTTLNKSRRGEPNNYSLTLKDCKYAVCRTLFLNTLGLGSFTVQSWTKKGDHAMSINQESANLNRARNSPHAEDINYLKDFLKQLPKLPSHYNRANSSKLYLEPIFKSLKQLYDLYSEHCKTAGEHVL
ncbi:uncharacterized protein LOC126738418 [Anthonomus grandis grandis]|uniref:uncharacterized protein LOC126738418 n=1 Tax=Anthonomus grandis grandis TaxID=2921223 RepID=UPI0021665FDA|nr:uncharacterized protein LOC126738418 [Anthonomus grandis grandis]